MKVLIIENEKKEAIKLIRILKLVDPSISVVKTLSSISALEAWMEGNSSADLVLVNHTKFLRFTLEHPPIQAKLVLNTRQHSLTYFAFRINTIRQLQFSKLPQPQAKGVELNVEARTKVPLSQTPVFSASAPLFKSRFFVVAGQKFLSIDTKDIAYFFSDGRFVYFITFAKNKYLVHYRMEELQDMLDPQNFYRINRTFIVSIKSIEQIHPYFGSRFKLKLNPHIDEDILVSRKRAQFFKIWLGE